MSIVEAAGDVVDASTLTNAAARLASLEGVSTVALVIACAENSVAIARLNRAFESKTASRVSASDTRYLLVQGTAPAKGRLDLLDVPSAAPVVALGAVAAINLGIAGPDPERRSSSTVAQSPWLRFSPPLRTT